MAYAKGSTITAADLNSFLASANSIYGVGTGSLGYGQTAITQANVTAGSVVSNTHWKNLRNMMSVCAAHQGTATTQLPPTTVLDSGDVITAHEDDAPSSNAYDIPEFLALLSTNRLNAAAGGMTLSSNVLTNTRNTQWQNSIFGEYVVDFASEDAARHFFNTGGQIRIRLSHPTGTGTQGDSWRSIFSTMLGTLTILAGTSTMTGSATSDLYGTRGYFDLETTNMYIFDGENIGSGAYTSNDLQIMAKIENRTGVRGGNGRTMVIRIELTDGTPGDNIPSGTAVAFDVLRATTLTGIALPTITVRDNL